MTAGLFLAGPARAAEAQSGRGSALEAESRALEKARDALAKEEILLKSAGEELARHAKKRGREPDFVREKERHRQRTEEFRRKREDWLRRKEELQTRKDGSAGKRSGAGNVGRSTGTRRAQETPITP